MNTIKSVKLGIGLAIAVALGSLPAYAGVGIGVAPSYPVIVDVGDTGVSASLLITNTADAAEALEDLIISDIKHTPACGTSGLSCPTGSKDPGVFDVNSPATGSAGSCDGMMFNVAITDASTGEVTFTPQSGSVVLGPKGGADDFCRISFTVDVLKLPTHDSSPGFGIMTRQLATAQAQAATSQNTGEGAGSGQTTVRAQQEVCEECLRQAPAVGVNGLAALALLLLGGGLGVMRRRRLVR